MGTRLPVALIDYLLYNYRHLRLEIESLGARQSGIGRIPPKGGRPGSPVENALIQRSNLTQVLNAVERAWRDLTPDLREVATAKYRRGLSNKAIMKRCNLSRPTLDRRLRSVRTLVAGHLALISEAILMQFWATVPPASLRDVRQRC